MFYLLRKWAGRPVLLRAQALADQFLQQTKDARRVQHTRLRELIARHRDSQFGRDHRFDEIQTFDDYRRRVPIRGYDGLEPYISKVRHGDLNALFGEGTRVLMFAMTSGTTSSPKTIPVTCESLRNYRDGWTIWGVLAFYAHPGMIERGMRPILQLCSDWRESTTDAGIPCGAITGLTAHMQNPLIRINYCMTEATSRVKSIEAKYYLALRLSVHRHLGAIIAANPATILSIARMGDREKESLIRDIRDGNVDERWPIPVDVRQAIRIRTRWKRKATADRLDAIVERTGHLLPKDYWPDLELLGNWTGGTMGAYLEQYPEVFGSTPIRDVGLIASEGRMTIPIEDGTPAGILDIRHHVFEFIPEDQIDREDPETVEASDLREGERYFILPTTAAGLYRYQIFDLIRCVGFEGEAPVIEFLNKGAHISSLTGEKLSEHQVVHAVRAAQSSQSLNFGGFVLVPTWADPPRYVLLVERADLGGTDPEGLARRLAQETDAQLQKQNLEYQSKRESRRLGPVEVRLLPPQSWLSLKKRRLARSGGTAEQYKQPCLIPDLDALEQFDAEVLDDQPRDSQVASA